MPIRESEKDRYPENWPEISALKRFKAGNKCQDCGLNNGRLGCRVDGEWFDTLPSGQNHRCLEWPRPGDMAKHVGGHVRKVVRIVLTVGHKNHQPEDCSDRNLRVWCQQCHLRYDAKHKAAGVKSRRRAARASGDLFEPFARVTAQTVEHMMTEMSRDIYRC